jgi:NAD(P)-dependent dehydrogenase (short-subunit alcohol dehydrogenase family)
MGERVAQKVAIVTGSANGIGKATVIALAREGAKVVVADLDLTAAEAVAVEINQKHGQAIAVKLDVGEEDSIAAMIKTTINTYGALHVLHNNAALTSASDFIKDTSIIDMETAIWDRYLQINLRGAMLGCKHAIPKMLKSGGGSIATAYGKQGIRCNAISPGLIMSERAIEAVPAEAVSINEQSNLVPRVGRPEDIAHMAVYLASDESSFITGQIMKVDGGQLAHLPHFAQMNAMGITTTKRE